MHGNREIVVGLANSIGALTGVEIGVHKGRQSAALLEGVPTLQLLHSVDPWARYEGWHSYSDPDLDRDRDKLNSWHIETLHRLQQYGQRSMVVRAMAQDYARFVKHKLCFAYIDGNHESPFVDRDIELWLPKVRSGGLLIGHDYGKGSTDVKTAVDKVFGDRVKNPGARVWYVEVE